MGVVQDLGRGVLGPFCPGPGFPIPISIILWKTFPNVAGSTDSECSCRFWESSFVVVVLDSNPALTSIQWHLGQSKYDGSLLGLALTIVE